jgi:hypothetical protein
MRRWSLWSTGRTIGRLNALGPAFRRCEQMSGVQVQGEACGIMERPMPGDSSNERTDLTLYARMRSDPTKRNMFLLLCFKSITPLRGCCSSEPGWIPICCSAARTMIAGRQAGHLLGHPCSLSISCPRSAPTSSPVSPDPCQHPRRSHPASARRSASIRPPWKRRSTPPRGSPMTLMVRPRSPLG